jgi:hypothetical protein
LNNASSLLSRTRMALLAILVLSASFLQAQTGPPPVITSISPTSGPVGTVVTIHGFNFGSQQGDLYFDYDGITITPSSWGDTTVVATIPVGMYGSLPFDVARPDGGWSNYSQLFEVTSAPDYSPIESPIVPHGYLTLTGYIGKRGPNSRIRINGNDVAILMWNEQYAQVKLPDTIGPGPIAVAVRNEYGETTRNYTVALAAGVRIQFDPSFQNFGTVTIGQSANTTISIANVGSQDASITSIGIEGSSEFTQSNGCGSQIYAGQSCTATVLFTPQTTGPRSGYLVVTTATGTSRLPLVGSVPSTGVLAASMKVAGAANLSTAQSLDWIHWGYQSVNGVRKAGVATPLINYSVIGVGTVEADAYNGQTQLKWSDGASPNASGSGSISTLQFSGYAAQNGSGYRVTVPADTSTRTLKLYAGAAQGRVEVRAYLSDGSAVPFVDSATLNSGDNYWAGRVIQFDYRAQSSNQTLTVELVMADSVGNYNNVMLQAATLEMAQPSVSLTSPADHSVVTGVPATITLRATAAQYDRSISKVEFYKNGTKIGESASSPYTLAPSIASGGDYVFVARAIDQNNLSTDSAPVTVHVVAAGGTLSGSAANSGGPGAIDLSTGTSDWVHWGYDSVDSVNRKAGVTPQISNFTVIGDGITRWPYVWNTMFGWTGGTPTDSVPYSLGAVYTTNLGQGFHLSVPAGTAQKTLKLYLGLYYGEGTLRATLSDGSAAPYVVVDTDTQAYDEKVYSITFKAASENQTLNVDYYVSDVVRHYVDVLLESATLTVDDAVTFSPTPYDFGYVAVGSSASQTFTLKNNDTVARSIALSATGSFSQSNTCPSTLSVGGSCTVTISFNPTVDGASTGGVTVTSDTYVRSAGVSGFGVQTPIISGIAANPATRGSLVTISGSNFLSSASTGSVTLNGASVIPTSWNNSAISFVVPSAAVTGPVVVQVHGINSNSTTLNVSISGYLSGRVKATDGSVNLSSLGAIDWLHWGTSDSELLTRKNGGNVLSDYQIVGTGTPVRRTDSEIAYSWTDGTSTAATADTYTGATVEGTGNGFRLVVPANLAAKTLRLDVATYGGVGQLTATLSDGSAATFTDSSVDTGFYGHVTYLLDFRAASSGQTLSVDYVLTSENTSPASVSLLSAALLPKTPDVAIVNPVNNGTFATPGTQALVATATQLDSSVQSVEFFANGTSLMSVPSTPYSLSWTNPVAGNYTLTALATDADGKSRVSDPVNVTAIGSGGTLAGSYADAPASIALDSGTSDWVHWGRTTGHSLDRKRCVTPQISDFTPVRTLTYSYSDGATAYSWVGGRPLNAATDTTTGVVAFDHSHGFKFTVPAGTDMRTLQVFVGLQAGEGTFKATLSDGSAAPFISVSNAAPDEYIARVYTLSFAGASSGQTLEIEYTMTSGQGYVALEAATLVQSGSISTTECPNIDFVTPLTAYEGDTASISGTGFGSSGRLLMDGNEIVSSTWNDTLITFAVPSASGSHSVSVETSGVLSNAAEFQILGFSAPVISAVNPLAAHIGDSITITGSNFLQPVSVSLGGAALLVTGFDSGSIKAIIPNGAAIGPLTVTSGGRVSNTVAFTVLANPVITSLSTSVAATGDVITISGSGLGNGSSSYVFFANTQVTAQTWSSTSVTVGVPSGFTSGPVLVETAGVRSNSLPLKVATTCWYRIEGYSGNPCLRTASSIAVSPKSVTMLIGESKSASITNDIGDKLTGALSSSDTTVVNIDADTGEMVGTGAGTATVTATSGGFSDTIAVTVLAGTEFPVGTVISSTPSLYGSIENKDDSFVRAHRISDDGPDAFAIETSTDGTAVVRGVTANGEQRFALPTGIARNQFFALSPNMQGGLLFASRLSAYYNLLNSTSDKGDLLWSKKVDGSLDGVNGSRYAVHPDGPIFLLNPTGGYVEILDPLTGEAKKTVLLPRSSGTSYYPDHQDCNLPGGVNTFIEPSSNLFIGADGAAYLTIATTHTSEIHFYRALGPGDASAGWSLCPFEFSMQRSWQLMRIQTDGSATVKLLNYASLSYLNRGSGTIQDPVSTGDVYDFVYEDFQQIASDGADGLLAAYTGETLFHPLKFKHIPNPATPAVGAGFQLGGYTALENGVVVGANSTAYIGAYDGSAGYNAIVGFDMDSGEIKLQHTTNTYHAFPVYAGADKIVAAEWPLCDSGPGFCNRKLFSIDMSGTRTDINDGTAASLVFEPTDGRYMQAGSVDVKAGIKTTSTESNLSYRLGEGTQSVQPQHFTLYLRAFAPWLDFGGGFSGDNRFFTTRVAADVTSRINGVIAAKLTPDLELKTSVYSDPSHHPQLGDATGTPSLTYVLSGQIKSRVLHVHMWGSNPLFRDFLSPDIDVKFDLDITWDSGSNICFYGPVYGDAFPNVELFAVDGKNKATRLLNWATQGDRETGPLFYLPGDNSRPMGTVQNCIQNWRH